MWSTTMERQSLCVVPDKSIEEILSANVTFVVWQVVTINESECSLIIELFKRFNNEPQSMSVG